MQENLERVLFKEEVLDLTGDSDDEIVKIEENISANNEIVKQEENISANKLIDGVNNLIMSSDSKTEGNISPSSVEETTQCAESQRSKSIRRFDQSLEKAIIVIKKGGSLDATALEFGIPEDVIYNKLISRSLPKEMDILTSAEELNLVQWILRANKNNTIVLKNDLLIRVGKMKKVADLTPIFAKSKFGKMWYDHFMRIYPEIYENDGILMPTDIGFASSSHSSSLNQSLSKPLTDLEENQLVEWILEMNHENKLVFKHDLLEKVRKLQKLSPFFVKSQGRKWCKEFLKKHPEIYENEELLLPSTSSIPRNRSNEQEPHSLPERFPRGPLKLKKDLTKQLHILGFKEALVVLHDCKHETKYLQSFPKKELRSDLSKNKEMCISECSSRVQQIELNREEITCDIKSEQVLSSEESVVEEVSCINKNKRKFPTEEKCSESDNNSGEKIDVKTENYRKYKKMKSGAKEADPMCTKCSKTFCNKSKLARHLTLHIPKKHHQFQCNLCFKKFPSKYYLCVHIKLVHSDHVYHCDECSRVFKHNTSLRKHKRTIHKDIMEENIEEESRSFICDVCQKEFYYKKSLKDHIIYGHLQTKKKYPCNICRKRFIKYSLMLRHKLRHVKTKPFACNNCTKTFSRKYLLREHSRGCKIDPGSKLMLEEEDFVKISVDYLKKLDLD